MNLFFSKFKNQNISEFLICKTQNNLKKVVASQNRLQQAKATQTT